LGSPAEKKKEKTENRTIVTILRSNNDTYRSVHASALVSLKKTEMHYNNSGGVKNTREKGYKFARHNVGKGTSGLRLITIVSFGYAKTFW